MNKEDTFCLKKFIVTGCVLKNDVILYEISLH